MKVGDSKIVNLDFGPLNPWLTITGIVEQEGRLSVFASSPAWSARLRFAMAELWPEVSATHAALQTWVVKVQPKAAETWGART